MKQPITILVEQICSETDGEEEEEEREEEVGLFVYGGINTWPGILQRGRQAAHLAASTWPLPAGYLFPLSLSLLNNGHGREQMGIFFIKNRE